MILNGDALQILKGMEAESVQCIVTSPPYYGLRSYGCDGEIGQEQTLQEFLSRLVDVFRECRRVLKKDGVCWVNMGDSYSSSATGGDPNNSSKLEGGKTTQREAGKKPSKLGSGFRAKDRMMVPARLAIALQDDGWWLRDEIVWHKPNPMPSSVQDRTTPAHEMIYLLTKSAKYYYNSGAIRTEPISETRKMPDGWDTGDGSHGTVHREGREKGKATASQVFGGPNSGFRKKHCPNNAQPSEKPTEGQHEPIVGANCRSVWTFSTQGYAGAHFATFPEELPTRCILAGSREGDVILDPFAGSGTTLAVAVRLGRVPLGIELNPAYIELAQKRIAAETPSLFSEVA